MLSRKRRILDDLIHLDEYPKCNGKYESGSFTEISPSGRVFSVIFVEVGATLSHLHFTLLGRSCSSGKVSASATLYVDKQITEHAFISAKNGHFDSEHWIEYSLLGTWNRDCDRLTFNIALTLPPDLASSRNLVFVCHSSV
jgi:hypothetical protein